MSSTSKPAAASPQPLLKQLLLTALLVAASCYSALRAYSTPLSEGPTTSQVWWFGWVTMLSTGLGAAPMLFVQGAPAVPGPHPPVWRRRDGLHRPVSLRPHHWRLDSRRLPASGADHWRHLPLSLPLSRPRVDESSSLLAAGVSDHLLGVSNAVAAGMMTSASAALLQEGLSLPSVEGASCTSAQAVAIGVGVGMLSVLLSQRALAGCEDVSLGIMEGVDVRKALLIVVVMTMHSFSEGLGIGVSFGGSSPPQVREPNWTRPAGGHAVRAQPGCHNVRANPAAHY